jgi:hypothetical protein
MGGQGFDKIVLPIIYAQLHCVKLKSIYFLYKDVGRSIPSFRYLIEIERLNWSEFKKELPTKNDKEAFDTIFGNAILYTQYLSNANKPVPIEPIMMGALFHNYKSLLKLHGESNLSEDSIMKKVPAMEREKPVAKALFDKTCERWRGLVYSLHKEDRERLLRMLVDCCYDSLDERAAKTLIDTESSISYLFLFCLVLQNQKLIERIKNSVKNRKNIKPNGTLFDYMD